MKRIIYSLYIDIPEDRLDWQPPYTGDDIPKTKRTKLLFAEHADWLKSMHEKYAKTIGVEYKLFTADSAYYNYEKLFLENYPQITGYNIVNFYKIYLLSYLADLGYDEILYLDFDAVPVTDECFFDFWNVTKRGVAILSNKRDVDLSLDKLLMDKKKRERYGRRITNRSPTAKYWNARAMLMDHPNPVDASEVYNTGIIGISSKDIQKLDYFGDFAGTLKFMDELKYEEPNMYPEHIRELFGWDNETLFAYKMAINNVKKQWLDDRWHYFFDKHLIIPKSSKIVHTINKNFDYVKEWCEKHEKTHL